MRLRSDDVRGFYDDDVVEFGAAASSVQSEPRRSAATSQVQSSSRSAEWQAYEKNLNTNLGILVLYQFNIKIKLP